MTVKLSSSPYVTFSSAIVIGVSLYFEKVLFLDRKAPMNETPFGIEHYGSNVVD